MGLKKNISIYSLGEVMNKAIPFLFLPILAAYITPAEYGIISNLTILLSLLTPLILVGTPQLLSVNYFKLEREMFLEYSSTALFLIMIFFIITTFLVFIFQDIICEHLSIPVFWLYGVLLVCFMQSFKIIYNSLLIVQKKANDFVWLQIFYSIVNVGFSLLFVVILNKSWQGRFYGIGLADCIILCGVLFLLYKQSYLNNTFKKKHAINCLKFGIPLLPYAIGMWVISLSNRFLITKYLGLEQVGLYAVGFQFAFIISVIAMSITKAWNPYLFEKLKNNTAESRRDIVLITYKIFGFLFLTVIMISLLSPIVIKYLFGQDYQKAIVFIPWISFGYLFKGGFLILVGIAYFYKKTKPLGLISSLCAIFNIGLNILLIKMNGAIGAAQANLLTFVLLFIIIAIYTHKITPLPWFRIKTLR
jgi:O-antigen/teichoic acid export membrane protein